MGFNDLRGFLAAAEGLGEVRTVRGATWQEEIGAITELAQHRINGPAVLFDDVPGYPSGYRILSNSLGSSDRTALVLGLPTGRTYGQLLPLWRERSRGIQPIPMRYVDDGPVMENVKTGDAIDMEQFPTPKWHELDGGRYLGTGSFDVTYDGGWVNLGCYRVMVAGRNRLGFYISPGKHGRVMRDQYFARGERMPVAMSFGHDPTLFLAASVEVPPSVCEYDYAGGIKGEPVDVIRGPVTGLPIPANAEIVVEGYAYPGETIEEGPFGEWTGYYASDHRAEPVLHVEGLYFRDNPIILGSPPGKPPSELTSYRGLMRSALVWEQMEKAGIPDVRGVWCHEAGGARLLIAVSIRQRYPGHARQAGHIAAMCHAGAYLGRYVIVVDEDVDVTDLNDVIWAMCTRAEPEQDFDLIRRAWSGPLDPAIEPGKKGFNSRMIIDATRPWEWRDKFPAVAESSPELRARTLEKWGDLVLGPSESGKTPAGARA